MQETEGLGKKDYLFAETGKKVHGCAVAVFPRLSPLSARGVARGLGPPVGGRVLRRRALRLAGVRTWRGRRHMKLGSTAQSGPWSGYMCPPIAEEAATLTWMC